MDKFNRFSIADWIWLNLTFWLNLSKKVSLPFSEQEEENILRWGMKVNYKEWPTRGNHTWLLLGLMPVITYTTSGASHLVHLWSQHLGSVFSRKHYFIPEDFVQFQYHNPGGLNLPYQQEVWVRLSDPFFSFSTSLHTQNHTLFWHSD